MDIITAMQSPELFGRWFKKSKWLGRDTWGAWRIFLKALFAIEMTDAEQAVYQKHTGRSDVSATPYREACLLVGRRGGKSRIAAFIATYLAAFKDYSAILSPGEVGTIALVASDRKQAGVLLGYINGFFDQIPLLAEMVESRVKESITLKTGIRIEIFTASHRTIRGFTILAAVGDEVCFWRNAEGAADADQEIVSALLPAMSTVPEALLLLISTPYARRGVMWDSYKKNFAKAGAQTFYWQAPSRDMNPSISAVTVGAAFLRDRAAAASEYGAQWRSDISGFIPPEVIEARVIKGRHGLPRVAGTSYFAFCDSSGGIGDSFTLAIGHLENGNCAVLDLLAEREPPFSPETVAQEYAELLKSYGCAETEGDAYSGRWVSDCFENAGIAYRRSELNRSQIYLETLPLVMAGQCTFLDNQKFISQLSSLERRTGRAADIVDHAPGGHDDLCNAACGVLVRVWRAGGALGLIEYEKALMAGKYSEQSEVQERYLREAQFRGIEPRFGGAGIDWKKPPEPVATMVTVATFVNGHAGTKRIPASQFHAEQRAALNPDGTCSHCRSSATNKSLGRCNQCGRRFWVQ